MTQPMDDLTLPKAWEWCEDIFWHENLGLNDYIRKHGNPLYTAVQMRDYAKKAVEAEQTIWKGRVKFTAERWEIECESRVKIEREACAKVCEAYIAQGIGKEMAVAIRARGKA